MKQTILYEWHKKLNAKWTQFSGWEVPLQYQRASLEHEAVRTSAGLFDISHMGLIHIPQVQEARLNAVLPVNVGALAPGKCQYGFLLNEEGGVVDDWLLYKLPDVPHNWPQGFLLVVNAGNTQAACDWLTRYVGPDTFQLLPDGLLALQGPAFQQVMDNTDALPARYHIGRSKLFNSLPPLWVARTGYTGEDGLEIICPTELMGELWQTLVTRLTAIGGAPCGFATRDTLRIEAALPLYGHELSTDVTPVEAGLNWAIDWSGEFVGKAALQARPRTRYLTHLKLDKPPIPREGCRILQHGEYLGSITSGTLSPTLGYPIAMGYASRLLNPDETVQVEIRQTLADAVVVKRPFYRRTIV